MRLRRSVDGRLGHGSRQRLLTSLAVATLLAGCSGGTYSTADTTKSLMVKATLTGHVETSAKTMYKTGSVTQSASASWTVTYIGTFTRVSPHVALEQSWHLDDLTGQVSWSGTGPDGPLTCTGDLSPQPDLSDSALQSLVTVEPPSGPLESEPFMVQGGIPSKAQAQSSDTDPAHAQCNTEVAVGFLGNGPQPGSVADSIEMGWQNLVAPKVSYFNGNPNPPSYTFTWSGSQPSTPDTSATLQVSGNWQFS